MYKGLTSAGLGAVGQLEQFIALASRYGYQAVDTSGSSLEQLIRDHELDGARQLLEQYQVKIGSIGLSMQWRRSDEEFRDGLSQFIQDVKAASQLGVKACCTYILPSTDDIPAKFMNIATKRLRLCAEVLDAFDMQLGLEFVGPHHLRTQWKYPFIHDMGSTLEWIEAINMSNVGLLLDSYHWYTNGDTIEDLLRLDRKQITHVHINDAPDLPIEEVLDNGRLYPGEGVIDLVGFVRALKVIGYEGVVSQEVLRQQPPEQTPEELVAKCSEAINDIFARAGVAVI